MFNNSLISSGVLLAGLLSALPSSAMLQAPQTFGEKYQAVPPVVRELTQIVYYRAKGSTNHPAPANVYVDGRYHTSLLPGGFTSFCLKAGSHTLGAFVNDPQYLGKTQGRYMADLMGGATYYLRVDEQQQLQQPPSAVHRQQGESEVKQSRRQIHARSRATDIVPCVYDRAAAQSASHYLFTSNELFKQTGGIMMLSDQGMEALNEMVVTVRQQHPLLHSVILRLETRTDGEGVLRSKAKAIRNALTLAAIPDAMIRAEFVHCGSDCPGDNPRVQILVR